jgi:formylglycine-generating enzyme required for sulfatase activity
VRTPAEIDVADGVGWILHASLPGRREVTQEVDALAAGTTRTIAFDLRAPAQVVNSIGMRFVLLPPGEFTMGTDDPTRAADGERPAHRVRLTREIHVGTTEVTNHQYYEVMGAIPSYFKPGRQPGLDELWERPVERVSYEQAKDFCRRLASRENLPPMAYRLPTEAEWEYMAVAGGDTVEAGWFDQTSRGCTRPVGRLKPNTFGLFDLIGNVAEWTEDWYSPGYFAESPRDDPPGASPSGRRVVRGGHYGVDRDSFRITQREALPPGQSGLRTVGFRVVRTVP